MFSGLVRVLDEMVLSPVGLDRGAHFLPALLQEASQLVVSDAEVPFARYLVYQDPAARYNIQLDSFSKGYTGGVHAHETWGVLLILRGGLWVEDWQEGGDGRPVRARLSWMGAGGGQVFSPPVSDWHRVSTRADGPQTISFHIYGQGFDLDQGLGMGPDGALRRYRRGPLGDNAMLKALFIG
jgi:hypothetical protein